MNWREFQYAHLHRLRIRLLEHQQFYADYMRFLKKLNYPPDHPLMAEAMRSEKQAREFEEIAGELMKDVAPYRPLVDPWRNHGLNAVLRADFEARGIE